MKGEVTSVEWKWSCLLQEIGFLGKNRSRNMKGKKWEEEEEEDKEEVCAGKTWQDKDGSNETSIKQNKTKIIFVLMMKNHKKHIQKWQSYITFCLLL